MVQFGYSYFLSSLFFGRKNHGCNANRHIKLVLPVWHARASPNQPDYKTSSCFCLTHLVLLFSQHLVLLFSQHLVLLLSQHLVLLFSQHLVFLFDNTWC